ncbi:unnamed protein product [Rotaria sp. Silwood2]|nr:unnamed protein product [Rotaria sp. Silwood2]CAF3124829.1 unnamed protein product [Rotaria sp. Silwood2]CAF4321995.1 unnamed protein product [Rotaria sp. Silwood2]CAF4455798.1 unnamed protein product [Rotaria sp. Silwood2]
MSNNEKQADELIALQSIFDKKFRLLDDNQYEILIEFDLSTSFRIQLNDKISFIKYLPALTLIIHYHDEYPSDYPPSFIVSCFYFSKYDLEKLCQKLDNYLFKKGEVCVYDWIEIIKQKITNELILNDKFQEYINDPRALNGYSFENAKNILQYLINYNYERENEYFQKQFQTCFICEDTIPGIDCIRLYRCGHFYCRLCLNNYIRMNLENGLFGEKLHCPQYECKQSLLPTEIKQILHSDQLYERYEKLTLQHSLELMNDILWCSRCQSPVLINNENDNLAICYQCHYTFCKKCQELYHSQTMCPKDYIIEQLRIQKEKEYQRLQKQKEEALTQLNKIEENKKNSREKKVLKQKYRQIVIKLSEKDRLLEEGLNVKQIESLNTQRCPNCNIRIEKNGGCSHMHCSRCDYHFTWQTIEKTEQSDICLLLNNYDRQSNQIESVKEDLNKVANIDNSSEQETDSDEIKDLAVSIDNKSTIGAAIVSRVRRCPGKLCKKLNIKIDQDNWIICNECMKQFCFLCGHAIFGSRHFEKKCQRYT